MADTWHSSDGFAWTQAESAAPWGPRVGASAVVASGNERQSVESEVTLSWEVCHQAGRLSDYETISIYVNLI